MPRNADSACLFCIDSNTKKGMLSKQFVTHVAPPLGRGHTLHMPVAKCWRLLKIEPNAWAGGKGSCAVCVDLQADPSFLVS